MSTDVAAEILLTCSILGFDDTNAFPVNILLSKTVGHLGDAIKNEEGECTQPYRCGSTQNLEGG